MARGEDVRVETAGRTSRAEEGQRASDFKDGHDVVFFSSRIILNGNLNGTSRR